jgi:crotonobetaine/carnitine-CoA ligase
MVIAENRLETLELLIAASWIGAVLVPVNPATPPSQLEYFLEYVAPVCVFYEGDHVEPQPESPAQWEELPAGTGTVADSARTRWLDGESGAPLGEICPQTPLAILLTSGTTGISKGVVCPQAQFLAWGESVAAMLDISARDTAYTCLPLFHTNALNAAFQCLVSGARLHIGPRFSSSRFWDRIAQSEATVTYLLGAMVGMLLNTPVHEREGSHRLTRILAPGTPVSAMHAFEDRFGVTLVEGHGMTETNAVIGTPLGTRRVGYMGRVMPGYQACVVDEFDVPVPDGVPGELLLRSNIPYAFATGYWQLPDVTTVANRNQWFHTGDRVVCEDGWFRFLDRIKDVIRRRGENISAWEVEHVLDDHPHVARSAVVPVPSELGEDEVMAFVIPATGAQVDPEELREHCATTLPAFARPRFIEFVNDLPLTDTGKVRKLELRERGVSVRTWDANNERRAVTQP